MAGNFVQLIPQGTLTRHEIDLVKYSRLTKEEKAGFEVWRLNNERHFAKKRDYYLYPDERARVEAWPWYEKDKRFVKVGPEIDKYDISQLEVRDLLAEFANTDYSKDKNLLNFYQQYGPLLSSLKYAF